MALGTSRIGSSPQTGGAGAAPHLGPGLLNMALPSTQATLPALTARSSFLRTAALSCLLIGSLMWQAAMRLSSRQLSTWVWQMKCMAMGGAG